MDLSTIITTDHLKAVGSALTTIMAIASAFCAVTPTPDANTTWGKVYKVIEFLAVNFGKAKEVHPNQQPQAEQPQPQPVEQEQK